MRVGAREETIDGLKVAFEFRLDVFFPELGRAFSDFFFVFEGAPRGRQVNKIVGFFEFTKKNFEFVGIVWGGHLSEEISGGEGAADDSLEGFAEAKAADFLGRSGAVDGTENGLNFVVVCTQGREIGSSKRAAAEDVAKGVFRARADIVRVELEVTGVVQQDRRESQFKLARGNARFDAGGVTALQEEHHADRGLQGVLEIMVAEIYGRVVGVLTRK